MEHYTKSWAGSWAALEERRANAGGDWPQQHWEVDTNLLLYGNVFYFSMLAFLAFWMKDREAYNPKAFMRFYNLSCVCLAGISGVCIGLHTIHSGTRFVCNTKGGQLNDAADGLLQWGFWFFYHQKFWEFIDSFIFMLRKSYRQVTFLHVFHHSSITVVTATAVMFDVSGDTYLAALLNSWVHVAMYGHYFLTSIGSKASAPLRPYLTSMQLIQFLIILGQNMYGLYAGESCGFADWHNLVLVLYMISMLVLFANFFSKSYGGGKGGGKGGSKEGGGVPVTRSSRKNNRGKKAD